MVNSTGSWSEGQRSPWSEGREGGNVGGFTPYRQLG